MVKVHDNRTVDERMLKDVEVDGYFMHCDVLCRRVCIGDVFKYDADAIPFIEIPCGRVGIMERTTWVLPLRDEQVIVSLEDWG